MPRRRDIATTAVALALLVAASPLARHSPAPVAGVRTALELIAGKQSKAPRADRPVPYGTA